MTTLQHEAISTIPPLDPKETCSQCNGQARWAVKIHEENEPLMFCFHHSYIVEDKIKKLNPFAIRDERLQFLMEEEANK